jgi:flagellar biosynthesis protein FlhF
VGLITVDTYRVAAVEQLRTYADIIDLPMEVVATPREMREAVARMSHLDLVLMDTAGRSPRDEVKIQELKSMLGEAEPDDVYLVLSSTSGAKSLVAAAERFADVGTTALLLTKLDEASSLGHLVSLVRGSRLPISYVTDGQNVPDDIQVAERGQLAKLLLGREVPARALLR